MKSILVTIFLIICAGSNLELLAQMTCDLPLPFKPEKVYGGYKHCNSYYSINVAEESGLPFKKADEVYTYDESGHRIGEIRYSDTIVYQSFSFKYDTLGQMIVWNLDYMDGQKWKVTYTYTKISNLLAEVRYVQALNNLIGDVHLLRMVKKYSYDHVGHLLEQSIYYGDTTNVEIQRKYYYNNKGKLDYKTTGNGGEPYSKEMYKYDTKGSLIELLTDGNMRETYSYDDKGNRIEMVEYYEDGNLSFRKTFSFDEKGNKLEEKEYSTEGELRLTEKYTYNDRGQVTEKVVTDNFTFIPSKIMYNYDTFGNLIEEVKYNHLQQPEQKNIYVYSK